MAGSHIGVVVYCCFAGALVAVATEGIPDRLPTAEIVVPENYTQTIAGSRVGFDMVAIPGGTFWIGSPDKENGRGSDEGPRRQVRIEPFWMGKLEVSWEEYNQFRKDELVKKREERTALDQALDAISRPTPPYPDEYRGFGKEGYPVVGISHHAAMEYCRWLSLKTGKAYRLPTEAEWEFACRAGTDTAYCFGNDPDRLGDHAWYAKNSAEETHPVGRKKPNPWGLHDMLGNVAEWCLDQHDKNQYASYPADRVTLSPVRLPSVDRYPHVVRGGSCDDPAPACRSSARRASDKSWNRMDPSKPQTIWWVWNADFVGFRVVRAVKEQANLVGIKSRVTVKSE